MAAGDRFGLAMAELDTVGDRKCYQGLGKAFLFRTTENLVEDYKSLQESNKKELEEVEVIFEIKLKNRKW